jgi:hypothetical protein
VYENTPFFTCELGPLHKIAFAVADDPFYKSERSKFYPECIVISKKGKVMAKINPFIESDHQKHKYHEKYGIDYVEGIREPFLKLNDDRKVIINLSKL